MVQAEPKKRVQLDYHHDTKEFAVPYSSMADAVQRQYCYTYEIRLSQQKDRIITAAKKIIGETVKFCQLEGLSRTESAVVVGTIEKRIGLRPSILKELAAEERILPEDYDPEEVTLISKEDYLEFEDEKQIVRLEGNITMNEVATGCVVGLYGRQMGDGMLHVERVIFPEPEPQRPWPKAPEAVVAFISGIELGAEPEVDCSIRSALTLFSHWLCGEMASSPEESDLASRVDRLVIAGESLAVNRSSEFSSAVRYLTLTRQDVPPNAETIGTFDKLVAQFTSKMCVDILGGQGDPCPQMWPQQPIHRCCLPEASLNGSALGLVSNPYKFSLAELDLLVTSGQNISDLRRLSNISDSCDLMEQILRWQHIAPTAPDTIDCFPFKDNDPLILRETPHVVVVGNQPKAEHRWVETAVGRILLIALPRFSKTNIVTLLNLSDMTVTYKYFGAI